MEVFLGKRDANGFYGDTAYEPPFGDLSDARYREWLFLYGGPFKASE